MSRYPRHSPTQFWQPQKVREWYTQVMDYLILNPTATYAQIAEFFGRHEITVGMVVRSDIFQAELRRRREARGEKVDESVREKLERITKKALDKVEYRIDKEGHSMPISDLRETTQMALDATGYGTSALRANTTQQVTIVISSDDLGKAREMMRKRNATEVDFKDVSDGTGG
jgi:hypothetical protein